MPRPPATPKLKRPSFPIVAEARLAAGYLRFWRVLARLVRQHVLPAIKAAPERQDAAGPPGMAAAFKALDRVRVAFAGEVSDGAIKELCATVGGQIDAHNHLEQSGMGRVLGIDIMRTDKHLRTESLKWLATNEALIKRTGGLCDRAVHEIGDIVHAGFAAGTRHETIAAQIEARLGVAKSRAVLIARDQTNKLNGQLTRDRQIDAGVTHYVWSTARDERVRPTHIALEGQVIAWGDPPPDGNPGEPIQCRCVAIPTVQDLKGERRGPVVAGASGRVAGSATLPEPTVFKTPPAPPVVVPVAPAPAVTLAQALAAAPAHTPTLSTLSLSGSTPAERAAFYEAEADEFAALMSGDKGFATVDVWQKFLAPVGGEGLTAAQLDAALQVDPALAATDRANVGDVRSKLQRMISRDAADRYGLERLATSRSVTCGATGPRGSYTPDEFTRDVINVGGGGARTILHEAGHWLETRASAQLGDNAPDLIIGANETFRPFQTSIIRSACIDFRIRRATSQIPELLSELTGISLYDASEVALPDKFFTAYVGKVYHSGDTEVFSVGLERFAFSSDIQELLKADKEHAGLILAILRGRVIP